MRAAAVLVPLLLVLTVLSGCAKAPVDVPDDPVVWALPELPLVDAAVALADLGAFAQAYPQRRGNSDTHQGAREALAEAFTAVGLDVWRQTYEDEFPQENICAAKIGLVEPATWIVVGGHYDTVTDDAGNVPGDPGESQSQGAYDDGSGVFITVHMAQVFAPLPSYYSVLFCAFDGEEAGLKGSKQVYNAMQDSSVFPWLVDETRAMLNFDMFGLCWPIRAPMFTQQNSPELLAETQRIRTEAGVPDDYFETENHPLGGGSDWATWASNDVPVAYFNCDHRYIGAPGGATEAPTPGAPGAYPFWHHADTMETMTLMAGNEENLQAGFQTALVVAEGVLGVMAWQPEITFTVAA